MCASVALPACEAILGLRRRCARVRGRAFGRALRRRCALARSCPRWRLRQVQVADGTRAPPPSGGGLRVCFKRVPHPSTPARCARRWREHHPTYRCELGPFGCVIREWGLSWVGRSVAALVDNLGSGGRSEVRFNTGVQERYGPGFGNAMSLWRWSCFQGVGRGGGERADLAFATPVSRAPESSPVCSSPDFCISSFAAWPKTVKHTYWGRFLERPAWTSRVWCVCQTSLQTTNMKQP